MYKLKFDINNNIDFNNLNNSKNTFTVLNTYDNLVYVIWYIQNNTNYNDNSYKNKALAFHYYAILKLHLILIFIVKNIQILKIHIIK